MRDLAAGLPQTRWHRRAWRALAHSLKLRLVALFVVLALATTALFLGGLQKALSVGWRYAAQPLVADYVDRLAAEVGDPPSPARAAALAARLPLSVRIRGPVLNWDSEPAPERRRPRWRDDWLDDEVGQPGPRLLERSTADGHRIAFGIRLGGWHERPRFVGWVALSALLLLTALAYIYVRRLLRPLDDIRAGAERFGRGEFQQPIPLRRRDELGDLAAEVNAMARDIHQMLEAKRGLLLAISHELRSPLTRARLHAELLPEGADSAAARDALLRDLAVMRDLVSDLLESERLASRHAALQLEPTDLATLARAVADELAPQAAMSIRVQAAPGLAALSVDPARLRLLLRNLMDNALRHSAGAARGPELRLDGTAQEVRIVVRDHGPGVEDEFLGRLTEPFFRTDGARQRVTGGVGLGLYLCRLVAEAHGGSLSLRNARPGLEVEVVLPRAARGRP